MTCQDLLISATVPRALEATRGTTLAVVADIEKDVQDNRVSNSAPLQETLRVLC